MTLQNIRAALSLPPRTHLWHAVVAGMLLAVFLATSHLAIPDGAPPNPARPAPADPAAIRVLILGTSQLNGLPEGDFTFPTLNRSVGGSSFFLFNTVFQSHAPRLPNLQTVIIAFDHISLLSPGISRRKGDFRDIVAAGVSWRDLKFLHPFDRFTFYIRYCSIFSRSLIGSKIDVARFGRGLSPVAASIAPQLLPETEDDFYLYNPPPGLNVPAINGWEKMRDYLTAFASENEAQLNLAGLHALFRECSRRNIAVIALDAPTAGSFRRSLPRQLRAQIFSLLENVRAGYPFLRLYYWNADLDHSFWLDLFGDPNHLNLEGNARFAAWIDRRLQLDPLPDDTQASLAPDPNFLVSLDPRESLWQWFPAVTDSNLAKYQQIKPASPPPGSVPPAFRLTLAPGQSLMQIVDQPIGAGDTFRASLDVWTDDEISSTALELGVARQATTPPEGAGCRIASLTTAPQQFEIEKTFEQDHPAIRFHIANRSSVPQTFIIMNPVLQRIPREPGDDVPDAVVPRLPVW